MPIGDLLASISGQPGAPIPAKRKAEDDIKPLPKAARQTPTNQLTRPLSRANGAAPRLYNGTSKVNGAKDSLKPLNGDNRVSKPSAPARPAPSANGAPQRPPKKGSFAEILARAKQAQQSMGQVGKIQHKKAEKKVQEAAPKPEARAPGAKRPVGAAGYQGTAKSGARPPSNGRNGPPGKDPRGRPMGNGKPQQARTAAQEEQDKKAKKAAAATTGYTGTARPKPNNMPTKKNAPPSRGGALLNQPPRRSSNYEDEYDEELDDFIEYDDEEDDGLGGGRQPMGYDSDASSDMEGGFDDLEIEDQRAAMIARREDIEEEKAEKRHRAEKEERKRKYLEQMRAKGR